MIFGITLFFFLLSLISAIICIIVRIPKTFNVKPADILIFAAHSDDCVIVGSEFASYGIKNDKAVKIAYLTCSSTCPEDKISRIRKNEALEAWMALGVKPDDMTFLDLPESPVAGPATYAAADMEKAGNIIKSIILLLPRNAAILIPADGELHIDHRNVRYLVLKILSELNRKDIVVYESPEYNNYLSLLYSPMKTVSVILHHIPFINRLIPAYAGSEYYIDGPSGFIFRNNRYLEKKRELLMHFKSQNINKLLKFFGYATNYRRLNDKIFDDNRMQKIRISAFGCICDLSAIFWAACLASLIFLTANITGNLIINLLSKSLFCYIAISVISIITASNFIIRAKRKRIPVESAIFECAASLGLFGTIFKIL